MPNPNIQPRPENLTRAGKGQPRKGHQKVLVSLPPALVAQLDAYAKAAGWNRSYTIEQLCKEGLNDQAKPNSPI